MPLFEVMNKTLVFVLLFFSTIVNLLAKAGYVVDGEDTDWVLLEWRKDVVEGSALDFSSRIVAPAGKYGFAKRVGARVEFEGLPGVRQRFHGVNLCLSACCPPHPQARVLARRLRKLGYNLVRIHHHENALAANAENYDRFEYLVSELIGNGIYLTTDLYVSRKNPVAEMPLYKALVMLGDEEASRDFESFASSFLTRRNKYTGRSFVEEPALVSLSLVNECHMEHSLRKLASMRQDVWKRAEEWAHESDEPMPKPTWENWGSRPLIVRMANDFQVAGDRRLISWVRRLGYRGLITNDNNGHAFPYKLYSRAKAGYDYYDRHFYIDHPESETKGGWGFPRRQYATNPLLNPEMKTTSGTIVDHVFSRDVTKPMASTEWQFCGCTPVRTMGGLLFGSIFACQDWDLVCQFAYSHGYSEIADGVGVAGYFNTSCDPILQYNAYLVAALWHRGDMRPLPVETTLLVDDKSFDLATSDGSGSKVVRTRSVDPSWGLQALFKSRVGIAVEAESVPHANRSLKVSEALERTDSPVDDLDYIEAIPDFVTGAFKVVTPRTCGVYSPAGASYTAGPLSVNTDDVPMTIAAISIQGGDLGHSDRILILHLADVKTKGFCATNGNPLIVTKLSDEGSRHALYVRRARASVALMLERPHDYSVYSLDTAGRRASRIMAVVRNGSLTWAMDTAGAGSSGALAYEVVRDAEKKEEKPWWRFW